MTEYADAPTDVSEWQFSDRPPTSQIGGGLLREVLTSVGALRDEVAAGRAALADASADRFAGLERQLAELGDALRGVAEHADREASATRAWVAEQDEAIVAALTEAFRSELAALSATIIDPVTQIAAELRELRRVLLGLG